MGPAAFCRRGAKDQRQALVSAYGTQQTSFGNEVMSTVPHKAELPVAEYQLPEPLPPSHKSLVVRPSSPSAALASCSAVESDKALVELLKTDSTPWSPPLKDAFRRRVGQGRRVFF